MALENANLILSTSGAKKAPTQNSHLFDAPYQVESTVTV